MAALLGIAILMLTFMAMIVSWGFGAINMANEASRQQDRLMVLAPRVSGNYRQSAENFRSNVRYVLRGIN
jgi:hypothetical protein